MRQRMIGGSRLHLSTALIVALLIAASTAGRAPPAHAHAPHDQVVDIAYPADFASTGVVLSVIRGRIMRSVDRGEHWREIVNGLGGEADAISDLTIAPSDSDVVYAIAASGELFRSVDGADRWVRLPAPPVRPSSIDISPSSADTAVIVGTDTDAGGPAAAHTDDGGATWTIATAVDGGALPVHSAAFAGDVVLAGGAVGDLHRSTDDGRTFEVWTELAPPAPITSMWIAPRATDAAAAGPDVVVEGADLGRLVRIDGLDATQTDLSTGLPAERIRTVAFADETTAWAVAETSGPYRSRNAGATWEPVTDGLTRSAQTQAVGAADFTTIAIAPGQPSQVTLGGFDGLFVLDSDATSWRPVETITGYISGMDVSPTYADDGTLVVFSYVRGAFVSTDRGRSWDFANDGLRQESIDEGNGFAPVRRLHNVYFSPDFARDQTILGADWVRLMRSTDGGASWSRIQVGQPPPDTPLRQFVLSYSPDFATDRTIWAGTRQGELFRSTQSGDRDTWERIATFDDRIRSIAASPAVNEDETIYVGTVGGAFRSTDSGTTWQATGVTNRAEVTGRDTDFGVQVAVSPGYADDGHVLVGTDQGLFETRDHGETWTGVDTDANLTGRLVEAIAFAPESLDGFDEPLILVSVRGVGLLRSTDGGGAYEPVGAELEDHNLLIADYANPSARPIRFSPTFAIDRTVYAFAQDALVRSTDAGVSWEVVELPSAAMVVEHLATPLVVEPAAPSLDSTVEEARSEPPTDGGDGSTRTALVIAALAVAVVVALAAVRRFSARLPS